MMMSSNTTTALEERLKAAGLRPTRQRLALASLLFRGCDRHVTAEQLHAEALMQCCKVSLATIYNTLNQFTQMGLLREVVIDPTRSYYDTNVTQHHHFYAECTGMLSDIADDRVCMASLPLPPDGMTITSVEVIIRLGPAISNS
jgi:Fur family iron response transcriptional regulator